MYVHKARIEKSLEFRELSVGLEIFSYIRKECV